MLKRKYMILSALAIMSVLAGSLFYNFITQAQKEKPLKKYKDSMRIDALSWREVGINFWGDGTYPFVFSPKEEFLNVTETWISVVISVVGERSQTIYLYLNGYLVYSWEFPPVERLKITFAVTNSTVLQSIRPEVNILQERHSSVTAYEMFMHEITLFIDYEYQAR